MNSKIGSGFFTETLLRFLRCNCIRISQNFQKKIVPVEESGTCAPFSKDPNDQSGLQRVNVCEEIKETLCTYTSVFSV